MEMQPKHEKSLCISCSCHEGTYTHQRFALCCQVAKVAFARDIVRKLSYGPMNRMVTGAGWRPLWAQHGLSSTETDPVADTAAQGSSPGSMQYFWTLTQWHWPASCLVIGHKPQTLLPWKSSYIWLCFFFPAFSPMTTWLLKNLRVYRIL